MLTLFSQLLHEYQPFWMLHNLMKCLHHIHHDVKSKHCCSLEPQRHIEVQSWTWSYRPFCIVREEKSCDYLMLLLVYTSMLLQINLFILQNIFAIYWFVTFLFVCLFVPPTFGKLLTITYYILYVVCTIFPRLFMDSFQIGIHIYI